MKTSLSLRVLCLSLLAFLPTALHAQLPKIFVASTGNDANDGSRGAPKRNFQAAHDAVATGGQIVVLDTAGYGKLDITKSLSITVPPGVNGFVTVAGTSNGITANVGSNGVVALRGLIIEGGAGGAGSGITSNGVGTLVIEDCTVRNFYEGIFVIPANAAQVSIFNTMMRGCSYGLDIETGANITVTASASGCRMEGCISYGALAYVPGAGSVDLTLEGCTVRGNAVGVSATGTNAVLRASNCTIIGNGTGVSANSSGQVQSRGNNTLEKNTNGNTFPASYSAK